jgi:hypothetical protein
MSAYTMYYSCHVNEQHTKSTYAKQSAHDPEFQDLKMTPI